MRRSIITAAAFSTLLLSGCGGAGVTNSNVANSNNNTNGNGLQKVDANNLPPGLSASPITPTANATPGIPAPANANVPKGATPTPGIPDPKDIGKPLKPGATPTPGIPSPEEIRRQLQQQRPSNVNAPGPTPSDGSMMKSRKEQRPVNRP